MYSCHVLLFSCFFIVALSCLIIMYELALLLITNEQRNDNQVDQQFKERGVGDIRPIIYGHNCFIDLLDYNSLALVHLQETTPKTIYKGLLKWNNNDLQNWHRVIRLLSRLDTNLNQPCQLCEITYPIFNQLIQDRYIECRKRLDP